MLMAVNSLFDAKRRKEIRQGISDGKLDLRLRKPLQRDISDEAAAEQFTRPIPGAASEEDSPLPPSMQPLPLPNRQKRPIVKQAREANPFARMSPMVEGPIGSPPAVMALIPKGAESLREADIALFEAIKAGDYPAAKDAIDRGADVNAENIRGSDRPMKDPDDTVIFSLKKTTPLALARELGRKTIEGLLKRHGATE